MNLDLPQKAQKKAVPAVPMFLKSSSAIRSGLRADTQAIHCRGYPRLLLPYTVRLLLLPLILYKIN